MRSRASAVSSFSASSTASRTKFLMIASPHGPSARRPKPPANPLTPAKPMPWISVVSPSSVATPASLRIDRISSSLTRFAVVIAEHADGRDLERAGDLAREAARLFGRPKSVRSPARTRMSAASLICAKSGWSEPVRAGAAVVQIAERRDTYDVPRSRHLPNGRARCVPQSWPRIESQAQPTVGRAARLWRRCVCSSMRAVWRRDDAR